MTMITRHFTFGTGHYCNHTGLRRHISDYWVTVKVPEESSMSPRELFIQAFTSVHCPHPNQFAFEYTPEELEPEYFPAGELECITLQSFEMESSNDKSA